MRFVKKKNIEVLVTAGGTRSYQPAWKLDVFSDRASWIDYILITNFDALTIIYS